MDPRRIELKQLFEERDVMLAQLKKIKERIEYLKRQLAHI